MSRAVMEAQGGVMTNKYAEGYPGKRYYGGCEFVDVAETLAIERAKKLFDCAYVNVQPHSGAQANGAVFQALLKPGDTILGAVAGRRRAPDPRRAAGDMSGKWFNADPIRRAQRRMIWSITNKSEALAKEHKPKLIICGGSAYPRILDFKRVPGNCRQRRRAAYGATWRILQAWWLRACTRRRCRMPTSCTTTTHKTLRGPRGGMILSNNEDLGKKFNSAVFPGLQGGR